MLKFSPITLANKNILNQYLDKLPPKTCEHSFTTLFCWQEAHHFEWTICTCNDDSWLIIKTTYEGITAFFPPIGTSKNYLYPLQAISQYCKTHQLEVIIKEAVARDVKLIHKAMPQTFEVNRERGEANYLYKVDDLINLKGKKFTQKRNHINKFKQTYPQAEILPLTHDLIAPSLATMEKWCLAHSCHLFPSLVEESEAIVKMLENYGDLDYFGCCVILHGKVVGFALGEELNPQTCLIHIEKGDTAVAGVYAVLNKYFLESNFSQYRFVNRAEDLGEANLRKAKLSYKPHHLVMKYTLKMK